MTPEDAPKLLGNDAARQERLSQLHESHVAPLTAFVEALREEKGPAFQIPYFDPWDGGVQARVLNLLEAPGPKAVRSGFISRNNPDETAKNSFELHRDAGVPRRWAVSWNIVPWYIGTGTKIRPAKSEDIADATRCLERLLGLLTNLRAIVLVGRKAQRAEGRIQRLRPDIKMFRSPHPSPLFVNNAPGNRGKILSVLRDVRIFLEQSVAR
jgi:hypothetical protein